VWGGGVEEEQSVVNGLDWLKSADTPKQWWKSEAETNKHLERKAGRVSRKGGKPRSITADGAVGLSE
jgi:hypothetical protein